VLVSLAVVAVAIASNDDDEPAGEALAGVLVGDGHDDWVVALTPEQPDVGPVIGAVVELAKKIVHGSARSGGSSRTKTPCADGGSLRISAQ
jgi:hypothetical protein